MDNDLALPRCDFCSSYKQVLWTAFSERAEITVALPETKVSSTMTSDDEWAVCDECIKFIRANDRDGLAKRSHEQDPMPGEKEMVEATQRGVDTDLETAAIQGDLSGKCFHQVLHDGLFWPGYKGRIEPVRPGERMVSRYVRIDTHRRGIIRVE
jgi:hypothetical protein